MDPSAIATRKRQRFLTSSIGSQSNYPKLLHFGRAVLTASSLSWTFISNLSWTFVLQLILADTLKRELKTRVTAFMGSKLVRCRLCYRLFLETDGLFLDNCIRIGQQRTWFIGWLFDQALDRLVLLS